MTSRTTQFNTCFELRRRCVCVFIRSGLLCERYVCQLTLPFGFANKFCTGSNSVGGVLR